MRTLLSVLSLSLFSTSAFAFTPCDQRMKDAAVAYHAGSSGLSMTKIKVSGFTMGAWTEAVGNNSGSGHVTVKANDKITFYEVYGKQIGTSGDCKVTDVEGAGAQG